MEITWAGEDVDFRSPPPVALDARFVLCSVSSRAAERRNNVTNFPAERGVSRARGERERALMRVLLVEDEAEMAHALALRLGRSGFIADHVGALVDAREALACHRYGLAILDRRLPDGDGLELLPELRRLQPDARILILTACEAVSERVSGLDAGADDYLAKPVDFDELMARVRACLRRALGAVAPPVVIGRLSFDLAAREVFVDGAPAVLHRRELALLETLVRSAGRIVLRARLVEEVYGFDDNVDVNALNILVSRLRKRLGDLGAEVEIHSARGIGYMLARASS